MQGYFVAKTLPISLVIPIRNESNSLASLFDSLNALITRPKEIIFIDTGSEDGSIELINDWINNTNIPSKLVSRADANPGAARNKGIIEASEEWIAFLDAGIEPQPDWLGALWQCRLENNSQVVYGCCRFESQSFFGQMLCAVSYGANNLIPVLPASLFHKDLFKKYGLFQEFLRAGEDIIWKINLKKERSFWF